MTETSAVTGDFFVRIRGIPWSCSRDEILKFFSDSKIRNGLEGIHFMLDADGRPSGTAFIELESNADLELALKKNFKYIGSRYIEVFGSDQDEFKDYKNPTSKKKKPIRNEEPFPFPQQHGPMPNDTFIRCRGLPFSCTHDDLRNFFQGTEIAPNGIKMPVDHQNKSLGEAFIQFASVKDADKAMTKHKEKIGHRYIEVFRSSSQEFYGVFNDGPDYPENDFYPPGPPVDDYFGPNRGAPPNWYPPQQHGGRGGYGPPMRGYGPPRNGPPGPPGPMGYGPRGGPPPPNWGPYGYDEMPQSMRGRGRPNRPGPYDDPYHFVAGQNGRGRVPPGGPPPPNRGADGPTLSNFVFASNLPFRALESDIMDFFSQVVTPVSVKIVFDDYGRPSGEAKIGFNNHGDAVRAMEKDKNYLFENCVELFLCSKDPVGPPSGDNSYNKRPQAQQQSQGPDNGPSNNGSQNNPVAASNYYFDNGANQPGGDRNMDYSGQASAAAQNKPPAESAGGAVSGYSYNPNSTNGNAPNGNGAPPANDSTTYSFYGMVPSGWRPSYAVPKQQQQAPQPPPASGYSNYSYANPYLAYGAGGSPGAGYSRPGPGHTIKKEPMRY